MPDPGFARAFVAEFGLTPEQYQGFVQGVTSEAAALPAAHLPLRRSDVVYRLGNTGAVSPELSFEGLALTPRARWDERDPANATARDWYPWRYARRLSILRRPLVQLSLEENPVVIVVPSILVGTSAYLWQAAFGELPETLFDSREMIACIGRAADRNGHDFARRVAARLRELGWETAREVSLSRFGGDDSLGDVDVLAWQQATGLVYAIECKSLRFDRTVGEIGERLAEYSVGAVGGDAFTIAEASRPHILSGRQSRTARRVHEHDSRSAGVALGVGDGETCSDAIRRKGTRDAGSRY